MHIDDPFLFSLVSQNESQLHIVFPFNVFNNDKLTCYLSATKCFSSLARHLCKFYDVGVYTKKP